MKKVSLTALIIILLCTPILFACNEDCSHENISSSQVEPTCDAEGYTLRRCADCGYEYRTEFVAARGHELSQTVFNPTCNEEGYTYYFCTCGYSFKSDHISPSGHTLRTEVHDPSCEKEGYTLYSCSCGYSYKSDFVVPNGHVTTQKVKAPSCTEEGYTAHTCIVCDYSFKSDIITPTGHTLKKEVKRATSFSDGYTRYHCECGHEYIASKVLSAHVFHGAYVESPGELARGIDVSKWNGELNWADIKAAGIDFVIIRAGTSLGKDPKFEENYAGAKAAGLDVGCYFYTYALSVESSLDDSDLMLEWIKDKKFEYPIYFDIEDSSQEALAPDLLTDICIVFIEKLQSNGYFCGLYANPNWLNNFLEADRLTPFVDIWLARWTPSGEPDWLGGDHTGLWQYTSVGKVGEHTCDFDMNIAYKNYPELIKNWGYNGY